MSAPILSDADDTIGQSPAEARERCTCGHGRADHRGGAGYGGCDVEVCPCRAWRIARLVQQRSSVAVSFTPTYWPVVDDDGDDYPGAWWSR